MNSLETIISEDVNGEMCEASHTPYLYVLIGIQFHLQVCYSRI